jgi:hypothetical protein
MKGMNVISLRLRTVHADLYSLLRHAWTFYLLSSRRYKCNSMLFLFIHDDIIKMSFINVHCDDEGTSFLTFVQRLLYPKGNNAPKDEGH